MARFGLPVIRPVAKDGREIRDVPLAERFSAATGRMPRRSTWRGPGTLLIAPPERPWPVWLFWRPGWEFDCWYVNLEDVHAREAAGVTTRDHVLDLVVAARSVGHRQGRGRARRGDLRRLGDPG
ncbi:MAG: DUF402 domain-containing protein [Chloroflexota bacterium]|nr:DUF402 domain-containing protein [Chloroflexota bacterium]